MLWKNLNDEYVIGYNYSQVVLVKKEDTINDEHLNPLWIMENKIKFPLLNYNQLKFITDALAHMLLKELAEFRVGAYTFALEDVTPEASVDDEDSPPKAYVITVEYEGKYWTSLNTDVVKALESTGVLADIKESLNYQEEMTTKASNTRKILAEDNPLLSLTDTYLTLMIDSSFSKCMYCKTPCKDFRGC